MSNRRMDGDNARTPQQRVILSERGPERFLQFGGGESKDLQLLLRLRSQNLLNFLVEGDTTTTQLLGSIRRW